MTAQAEPTQDFPRRGGATTAEAAPQAAPEGRSRVLLVEDDPDFREVVSRQLQRQGFDVVQAESAGTAWTLAHEVPLEAVVLDFRLPCIDGQTLAYQLRHEFGDQLKLLAFTSWPADQVGQRDVFDSIHTKPDVQSLIASLSSLHQARSTSRTVHRSAPAGAPAAGGPHRVERRRNVRVRHAPISPSQAARGATQRA